MSRIPNWRIPNPESRTGESRIPTIISHQQPQNPLELGYYNEPSFEPLLALLGAIPAILEMMISSGGGNTSVKDVESKQGGVSLGAKTGGDMKVEGVTAKTDVNITNE